MSNQGSPAPQSNDPMSSMMSSFKALQADTSAAKDDLAKSTANETTTEDLAYKGYKATTASLADDFSKLQKEGSELKPFEPPKAQDPLKDYGAAMAGLIGIASFFTRGSMVTALNAGAAAINAARQNNTAEYDKAFDAWKTNTEFSFKKLDWENNQLKGILDLANTDYNAAGAHIKTLAAITNDKALSLAWDAHGIEGASQIYSARVSGQREADEHSNAIIDLHEKKMVMDNLKQALAGASTPQERLDLINQAMGKGGTATIIQSEKDQLRQQLEADALKAQGGRALTGAQEASIRQKVEESFKPSSAGSMGSREATYMNRVISGATLAVADAGNIMDLPITVNRGILGGRVQGPSLYDATKEDLANTVTSQEAQLYNNRIAGIQRNLAAIEAAGLAPSGTLQHMMDNMVIKEGDTYLTKLDKMAQIRQIITQGLEPYQNNPRVSDEQRGYIKSVVDAAEKAIPFTHSDVTKLYRSGNPTATIREYSSVLSPTGKNIPQAAIDKLKKSPTNSYKTSFDSIFGKGAADNILAKPGDTGGN